MSVKDGFFWLVPRTARWLLLELNGGTRLHLGSIGFEKLDCHSFQFLSPYYDGQYSSLSYRQIRISLFSYREPAPPIEALGQRPGAIDVSCSNERGLAGGRYIGHEKKCIGGSEFGTQKTVTRLSARSSAVRL